MFLKRVLGTKIGVLPQCVGADGVDIVEMGNWKEEILAAFVNGRERAESIIIYLSLYLH